MSIIRYSINNPLMINLMLAVIVVVGVMSWMAMPQELFPVVQKDKVQVTTQYEGASPEEVEQQVTVPLEDEFGCQVHKANLMLWSFYAILVRSFYK